MHYLSCDAHLHADAGLVAVEVGIHDELADGLNDLLEKSTLKNLSLKHIA